MNDIERKVSKALDKISEAYKEAIDALSQPIEPTQPEGYQGLNKWYLIETGALIRVTLEESSVRVGGYGINYEGKWVTEKDKFSCAKGQIERELTESEIKKAILKGCEQNGIVEGVKVNPSNYIVNNLSDLIEPIDSKNEFYIKNNEGKWVLIFDNGKFAEVVKEDKTTDKQLLKECKEFIGFICNNHGRTDDAVNLLTKLNKHLNHE